MLKLPDREVVESGPAAFLRCYATLISCTTHRTIEIPAINLMLAQAYLPFRTSLITKQDLRTLSLQKPGIAIRDTLLHWALIIAAYAIVVAYPNIWTGGGAFVAVGINLYGLYIIGHDGLHRRLFASEALNDLWNDLFVVGPFGAITRVNRHNHMHHHKVTCLPEDPDRHKYTHEHKEPVLPFMVFLTGLANLGPAVRNVFMPKAKRAAMKVDAASAPQECYKLRDVAILLGWQAGLIGGLTYSVGWWGYPLLWAAPAYVFAYRGDLIRVFCEHSALTDDAAADDSMRLITYKSFWVERLLFAPHNMNYHMPHHLWPSIPYYNLPEADRLIRNSELVRTGDDRLVWRSSYLSHLFRYFVWRSREQRSVDQQRPITAA
jgi:fatty acid desaturase